jgi:hypothetical protein
MHADLVVPGLLGGGDVPRLPALELLLARGRRKEADAQTLEDWARGAFELGDDPFPAGALSVLASGASPGADAWMRADPVHLRVMQERAVLMPAEALELSLDEARALCEALNAQLAGMEFTPFQARRWYARLPHSAVVDAGHPLQAAGRDAEPPTHAAALLTEAQMVLHAHPVNEAREARGAPTVNSLWFWGGGRAVSARSRWQSVAADDPALLGAARLAGARHRPLPPSAGEWLARLPQDGRQLALLDALRAPVAFGADLTEEIAQLERDWFAPLLDALRSGRIGMATIHVPDAAQAVSFETIRGDLRRFWRRRKPIKELA